MHNKAAFVQSGAEFVNAAIALNDQLATDLGKFEKSAAEAHTKAAAVCDELIALNHLDASNKQAAVAMLTNPSTACDFVHDLVNSVLRPMQAQKSAAPTSLGRGDGETEPPASSERTPTAGDRILLDLVARQGGR